MIAKISYQIKAVLNSYAILFFSQNKVLGILLLVVSFFNIPAGLTGLCCVLVSLAIIRKSGFQRDYTQMGLYSFNALLVGLAFGTFYQFNLAFVLWVFIATLITIVISVILSAWLGKYNLPVLSVPFIITYWVVMLAADQYGGIGLHPQVSGLGNQISGFPNPLPIIGNLVPDTSHLAPVTGTLLAYADLFFRALSALVFQNSVIAGIILSIGVFIHSRISFSLLIIGFVTACLFQRFTGLYPECISYYNLGANFMMVAAAIGSFFIIPSARSYLLAVISIPAAFLLVNALSKLAGIYNLPVFSLPFCLITISLLYFFTLRILPGKIQLTPLQHYSPEKNLYQFANNKLRLDNLKYLRLNLPFMGAWTVSQGYEGDITHKDDWAQALDFVITDNGQKTYDNTGTLPEHFYCFNKPVLACADGIIETVTDNIADNRIGQTNLINNWGNTVVIKHTDDLYSKVSHLKKNSIKVRPGDIVKQGDLLGLCGNSGRSPEPHLHFQVQLTPYIGSKTLAYPFAEYIDLTKKDDGHCTFSVPSKGTIISPVENNISLKQAFAFEPGYQRVIQSSEGKKETWNVLKEPYGSKYLYCKETESYAYFTNNDSQFYFTAFYGDESSLLYYFYTAAYHISFNTAKPGNQTDTFPLRPGNSPVDWFFDLAAPFCLLIRQVYKNTYQVNRDQIVIIAQKERHVFNSNKRLADATLMIDNNKLKTLHIRLKNKTITAQWDLENIS